MTGGVTQLRQGDTVCFSLESVYLPTACEVLASLKPEDRLIGTITQFSESITGTQAFAVVSLPGYSHVVVPVEKLARILADAGHEGLS
jgi:hypothetical protein